MKSILALSFFALFSIAAHAEYEQVNMTVFGMDCAPCAHAIHVSMKGIKGVDKVDVDLNTGLVAVQLTPGNSAAMEEFNRAVEKNGFTHKDAKIVARGRITGTASSPVLEVTGTNDKYLLAGSGANMASMIGKAVTVTGTLPQAPKGKIPDTLKYDFIAEAK
ncbi:MAG TPA: heavy metal-associated domain-containing protein [Bryocella sp.]|nr:heavy metal-associated domain-containing protein [Bryocella sp.]